jgi:predicted Fe-Mo cluster-binding NifX family protein
MDYTIIVTTEADNGLESPVSTRFGRSPFYLIVRVQDGRIEAFKTEENRYFGGHQLGLMRCACCSGARVLLAGGMEPRVVGMFNDLGIEVCTDCGGDARGALQQYLDQSPCRRAPTVESFPGARQDSVPSFVSRYP